MLAIGVELLTGRYVATSYNDRTAAEWPPHPSRLYSALVAAWADVGADSNLVGESREVLRWLEQQAAPEVLCSSGSDLATRSTFTVFVPVNDVATVKAIDTSKLEAAERDLNSVSTDKARAKAEALLAKERQRVAEDTAAAVSVPSKFNKDRTEGAQVLPEARPKQPRHFPSVCPSSPNIVFVWPDAAPLPSVRSGLQALLRQSVRLGHSSSLVACRLLGEEEVQTARAELTTYRPDKDDGTLILRWVAPGQLERLEEAYSRHQESEPRVLPASFVRYREGLQEADAPAATGEFSPDDTVVFARVGGPRLPMTSAVGVATQFRRALMAAAHDNVPALLSGHNDDGSVLQASHVAIVPLPVVGGPHSDGALLGIGLFFPKVCDPFQRQQVLRAIAKLEREAVGQDEPIRLLLGASGVLELQRVEWGEDRRATLQPGWWTRASRTWASATPVALDRNPGDLHDSNPQRRAKAFEAATEAISTAVVRAGYPAPIVVDVVRSCVLPGSEKPRVFPRFPANTARVQRVLVHVRLEFAEPVRGPLLLGAGRFVGLGVFLPVDAPSARNATGQRGRR